MKLRTKKSHLHNLPEGRPPRRILPLVMKFVYFLILAGILGGVCYVVVLRYLYFKGTGQVEIERHILSAQNSGWVMAIDKQAGDDFVAGDRLAAIDLGPDCPEQPENIRPLRLSHQIKALEAEYRVYRSQLADLTPVMETSPMLYRALETGPANRALREQENIVREQARLKEKTALLAAQINARKKELAALEQALGLETDPACAVENLNAPFSGTIFHVTRRPNEYIDKGDALVVVTAKNPNVFIEAYLDWKLLEFVRTGERVDITFPDGLKTKGIVSKIASNAAFSPRKLRKDYLPVASKLGILVFPLNEKDGLLWKQYDRMEVLVTGERR